MIPFIYHLAYALPLTLMTVLIGGERIGMTENPRLACLLAIVFQSLVVGYRYVEKKYRFLFVGFPLVLAIGRVLGAGTGNRVQFLLEHDWVGTIFITAVVTYFAGRILMEHIFARRAAFVGIVAMMAFAMFQGIAVNKPAVMSAFFAITVYIVENIQQNWKKSGYTEHKAHMVHIVPFLLVLSLSIGILPTPDHPFEWKLWHSFVDYTSRGMERLYDCLFHEKNAYAVVDFSEDGKLMSLLGNGSKSRMNLTPTQNTGDTVYLSGKIFDTFTGREWLVQKDTGNPIRMMDTLETTCALRTFLPENYEDVMVQTAVGMEYLQYNETYLFLPSKPVLDGTHISYVEYTETNESVRAKRNLKHGQKIKVYYLRLNEQAEAFREFMKQPKELREDDWNKMFKERISYRKETFSFEEYQKYKKQMHDTYGTQVSLSRELEQLMKEIYAGADSEYEKMKRLETWLSTFSYSLTPGELPEQVQDETSFLDYLLLEKKEGYCVHYATAFALLARAEGLPARYVQGYQAAELAGKEKCIRSDNAHGWPEVYFDNVGWIRFEPTPGYANEDEWIKQAEPVETPKTKQQEQTTEAIEQETRHPGKTLDWRKLLIPVTAGILFLLIFIGYSQWSIQRNYKKANDREKVRLLCERNMKKLSRKGYAIKQGETLCEYRKRIGEYLPEELVCFIDAYELLSYSDHRFTAEELKTVERSANRCKGLKRRK